MWKLRFFDFTEDDIEEVMLSKQPVIPGDDSRLVPPESISNSEVKQTSADDSVGYPHVKVGYCQDFIK